jgi:hypothetical protein
MSRQQREGPGLEDFMPSLPHDVSKMGARGRMWKRHHLTTRSCRFSQVLEPVDDGIERFARSHVLGRQARVGVVVTTNVHGGALAVDWTWQGAGERGILQRENFTYGSGQNLRNLQSTPLYGTQFYRPKKNQTTCGAE